MLLVFKVWIGVQEGKKCPQDSCCDVVSFCATLLDIWGFQNLCLNSLPYLFCMVCSSGSAIAEGEPTRWPIPQCTPAPAWIVTSSRHALSLLCCHGDLSLQNLTRCRLETTVLWLVSRQSRRCHTKRVTIHVSSSSTNVCWTEPASICLSTHRKDVFRTRYSPSQGAEYKSSEEDSKIWFCEQVVDSVWCLLQHECCWNVLVENTHKDVIRQSDSSAFSGTLFSSGHRAAGHFVSQSSFFLFYICLVLVHD